MRKKYGVGVEVVKVSVPAVMTATQFERESDDMLSMSNSECSSKSVADKVDNTPSGT